MRFCKWFSLLVLLFTAFAGHGQTKPIAYRSHSGNMKYFTSASEPDNLGEIEIHFDTIYRLSSTSVLRVRTEGGEQQKDTLTQHWVISHPETVLDSMRMLYDPTTYIGFDSIQQAIKTRKTAEQQNIPAADSLRTKDNTITPVLPPADNQGPQPAESPLPTNYFIFILLGIMLAIGTLTWTTNRKKIITH